LILPQLLDDGDLNNIRAEIDRLKTLDIESVYPTNEGCTIYGFHESDGEAGSEYFNNLIKTDRFLGLAKELLGDDELYIYNSKMNCKNSLIGSPMHWHQDYEYWYRDGVGEPDLITFLILPEKVEVHDGCLYLIPGSHKMGHVRHQRVMLGSHKQVLVNSDSMASAYKLAEKPVPLVGPAGTVVVFHANTIHGSSNNLGIRDRWQVYLSYNRCSNAPTIRKHARPDFVVSRNTQAL
jgi:ectoine hydroxylase